MLGTIGIFTYLAAGFSFAVLSILLLSYWRVKPLGASLFVACLLSCLWALAVTLASINLIQLFELLRNASWLFVLLQLLGLQRDATPWSIQGWHWRRLFFLLTAVAVALMYVELVLPPALLDINLDIQVAMGVWLIMSLLGLFLVEQLFRNASQNQRWSIKYLCFGLGAMFTYDFFMYSEALLFGALDLEFWQARGLVNAFITPLLAVAIARNSDWKLNLHVSRQVVFHTVTLMGAGIYLLGMGFTGYLLAFVGGSWGGVLQMSFLAAAAMLFFALLFSGKLRAHVRVFLSKHFFSYRYDYREEWLKFTQALSELNENVGEGIIRIMAPLVDSHSGLIWVAAEGQPMRLYSHWEMPPPPGSEQGLGSLPDWLHRSDWVIDLKEWRHDPELYGSLNLPDWLQQDRRLWLIVPLVFRDKVEAVLMLGRTDLKSGINWEDRDLLKTAGRQAATHLAQHLASTSLIEARQFDAFNRLSAYVVHDLKNILAQQSLIVSNAARHRDNPAFIDDMISTVENSVTRMQRLMEQMRSGIRAAPADVFLIQPLLQDLLDSRRGSAQPLATTTLHIDSEEAGHCAVEADRGRLFTVFNHLLQNAYEATPADGRVALRLACDKTWVKIAIEDTGTGMDDTFLRERLFKPFESTKGLTGMGIGAFESREYIRQLGGDITVQSTPGEGSTFFVTLPRQESGPEHNKDGTE